MQLHKPCIKDKARDGAFGVETVKEDVLARDLDFDIFQQEYNFRETALEQPFKDIATER